MRSVVLMFGSIGWSSLTPTEQALYFDQHRRFVTDVNARPGCAVVAGEALATGERAVLVRFPGDGQLPTEGPFADATERLGGFYVVETPDKIDLLDLVKALPSSYTLEIRPVLDSH